MNMINIPGDSCSRIFLNPLVEQPEKYLEIPYLSIRLTAGTANIADLAPM